MATQLTPADLAELKQLYKDLQGIQIPDMDAFVRALGGLDVARKNLEQMRKEFNNLNSDANYFASALARVVNDIKKQNGALDKTKQAYNSLHSLATKLKNDHDGITDLTTKELTKIQQTASLDKKRLELARDLNKEGIANLTAEIQNSVVGSNRFRQAIAQRRELIKANDEINRFLTEEELGWIALNKAIEERLELEDKIRKNLGATGVIYSQISKTLAKIGFDSQVIADIGKDLRDAAKEGQVGFMKMAGIIKKGLKEALTDPLIKFAIGLKLVQSAIGDFKKVFAIFKEYNMLATETARNLGMSVGQIEKMGLAAKFSGDKLDHSVYSAKQLSKAITEVNEGLGISVDLGAETTREFAAMTNQMGLTAQEATQILKISILSGQTLRQTNQTIAQSIISIQKGNKLQLSAKQIYQEIGKLSTGILLNFNKNPGALAKAVAQAKALGTNLDKVNKTSDSLLDFESSIQKQMEAELLTGRQINLDRARYLAMTNQTAELTKEIAKQAGNLQDYQAMNVFAQKSLAEAFGMSRDEMAEMLQQQEVFNKLGDVSGKSAQEQLEIARQRGLSESDSLLVNLKQQAAAEKLEALWDGIKMTIAKLAEGPLGKIVSMFASLAQNSTLVYGMITLMAGVSLFKLIGGLIIMTTQLAAGAISAMALVSGITLGLGAIAVIAGLASMMGAFDSSMDNIPKAAKGGIVPKTPGGMPVRVGEGGKDEAIIPLDSAKGNELLSKSQTINPTPPAILRPTTTATDMGPVVAAIVQLQGHMQKMADRPIAVGINVDGSRMANAVAQNVPTGYGNILNPSSQTWS